MEISEIIEITSFLIGSLPKHVLDETNTCIILSKFLCLQ